MNTNSLSHLLDLLAVEGASGAEAKVVTLLTKKLLLAGCKEEWIKTDDADVRLGDGYEVGNLIVTMPGTFDAPRILFSAHMDTVPLCKGCVPIVEGARVVSQGATGLGGDDRAGCAAMLSMVERVLVEERPYPPMTLVFPIAEENGLHGSRMIRLSDLGDPVMGFNLDAQNPAEIIVGAMSAARWRVEIEGRSTHAGLEPQKGISAGLIAAKAMSIISDKGYFGRIQIGAKTGTSNLGTMKGGEANNQVMDRAVLTGECRSHDPSFLEEILAVYKESFDEATEQVVCDAGDCGAVHFATVNDYRAFLLDESEACVQRACEAARLIGLEPVQIRMDAGLDASNFNALGLPTVTLGTGTYKFHQLEEYIEIKEYLQTCNMLLEIVQLSVAEQIPAKSRS